MTRDIIPFTTRDRALADRIEKRVVRIPESGCWIWMGKLDKKGYGRLSIWHKDRGHYVPTLAHRLSFSEFVRPVTAGSVLRHRCDVPCCVNPHHLEEGTQQDNLADMRAKGRDAGGAAVNRAKTHCNAGHPLSGSNLRIEGARKARRCKACENIKKGRNNEN